MFTVSAPLILITNVKVDAFHIVSYDDVTKIDIDRCYNNVILYNVHHNISLIEAHNLCVVGTFITCKYHAIMHTFCAFSYLFSRLSIKIYQKHKTRTNKNKKRWITNENSGPTSGEHIYAWIKKKSLIPKQQNDK